LPNGWERKEGDKRKKREGKQQEKGRERNSGRFLRSKNHVGKTGETTTWRTGFQGGNQFKGKWEGGLASSVSDGPKEPTNMDREISKTFLGMRGGKRTGTLK